MMVGSSGQLSYHGILLDRNGRLISNIMNLRFTSSAGSGWLGCHWLLFLRRCIRNWGGRCCLRLLSHLCSRILLGRCRGYDCKSSLGCCSHCRRRSKFRRRISLGVLGSWFLSFILEKKESFYVLLKVQLFTSSSWPPPLSSVKIASSGSIIGASNGVGPISISLRCCLLLFWWWNYRIRFFFGFAGQVWARFQCAGHLDLTCSVERGHLACTVQSADWKNRIMQKNCWNL